MASIRVYKLDEQGDEVWHYDGEVLFRDPTTVKLQAYFSRADIVLDFHTFRRGDRMVEWFFNDRWYNVFEMHDADDDRLKGWYCNITRPARLESQAVYAEDLALDLMVYPDGSYRILDEDEFAVLEIDAQTRQKALATIKALREMVIQRKEFFSLIEKSSDTE